MANPAEHSDLPALFFASFFWTNKRKKVKVVSRQREILNSDLCMSNVYVKELIIFYPFKIWVKGSCLPAGLRSLRENDFQTETLPTRPDTRIKILKCFTLLAN